MESQARSIEKDEPAVICALCGKPIRFGMGIARVADVVVHVRCVARQTGMRALEIEARAGELVRRSAQLRAEGRPFVLTGRVTALDADARLMTVGVLDLTIGKDVPLDGLALGVSITAVAYRRGQDLIATTIRVRRPGFL